MLTGKEERSKEENKNEANQAFHYPLDQPAIVLPEKPQTPHLATPLKPTFASIKPPSAKVFLLSPVAIEPVIEYLKCRF